MIVIIYGKNYMMIESSTILKFQFLNFELSDSNVMIGYIKMSGKNILKIWKFFGVMIYCIIKNKFISMNIMIIKWIIDI